MAEKIPQIEPVEPPALSPVQVTFLTLGEELTDAADYRVFTAWFPTHVAAHTYARRKCMEPEYQYRLCYMIGNVQGLFIPVPTMQQVDRMPAKTEDQLRSEQEQMLSSLLQRKAVI